jgi:phosphatidylserine/phosphatidylglycerophosphate/cardiolipin synthase-like enzyme
MTVNALAGTHVVVLGLDMDEQARRDCLGFAIQRRDHTEDERYWMRGNKVFAETAPLLGPGEQVSSREHPFQSFQWSDYSAKPDHDYTYTVIPLQGEPSALTEGPRVKVSVSTESELGAKHSVFFNRAAVASQEYARRFQNRRPDSLPEPEQEAARVWLSRGLYEALLAFIGRAKSERHALHGAIYEFQWPGALAALRDARRRGADVHVLYDGIKSNPRDANEREIATAQIKSICEPRTRGTIMHNKFLVLAEDGEPVAVWTGSTNWTEQGIFGHLNSGHIVEDARVAEQYLAYWRELRTNPTASIERTWIEEHNPYVPRWGKEEPATIFSPHQGTAILDGYAELAGSAEHGLFMSFAFGMAEPFRQVYERNDEVLRFALMDKKGSGKDAREDAKRIDALRRRRNVVVAVGSNLAFNDLDRWVQEIDRITPKVNVRWVHTKFMLVDPLSEHPTTVTGSANFSGPSTDKNNENMLVIRGDTRVADIYLGEFMRQFSHYAFREAATRDHEAGRRWQGSNLMPDPSWIVLYFEPGTE